MDLVTRPLPEPLDLSAWPQAQRVVCAMSDFSAVPRGKVVDLASFVAQQGCRLSSALWGVTLSGDVVPEVLGPIVPQDFADMQLLADASTLRQQAARPQEIHAICEPHGPMMRRADGHVIDANELSPRAALRRVLRQWQAQGWQATVAPELEFFLLQAAPDQNPPWTAARPAGHMGVQERACESNSLERLAHFDAFFDALYAGCDDLAIPITGHDHEAAFTQYEVNFAPGEPLAMADAVFRFKTLVKTTAARMGFIASFTPKPFVHEPGTGMHWHVSVQDRNAKDWPHLFARPDGSDTAALAHFAAGIQHHAAAAMAFFAPHNASYDRIQRPDASPTTASFGREARDLALRVPTSGPTARRLENRLPGGDSNPYLVLAATLATGLWGLQQQRTLTSSPPPLPTQLIDATTALDRCHVLRDALGDTLINAQIGVLRTEHQAREAHPHGGAVWDAMHLLEGA